MPPTVVIDKRFRQFEGKVETAIDRALTRAAAVGVQVAREKETREQTGALRASIRAGTPARSKKGREISIVAADGKALWHELGTLKRRRRKLKSKTLKRRASASGAARLTKVASSQGVKPLYFLNAAKRIAGPRVAEFLRQEMPKR